MADAPAMSSVSLQVVAPTDKARATSNSPAKVVAAASVSTPSKPSNSAAPPRASEPTSTVREVTEEQQKAVTPRVYSLVIHAGKDLLSTLHEFTRQNKLVSGVIMSCVGEVESVQVSVGGDIKVVQNPRLITSASGIVNCIGYPRLHANMVNKNGEAFGGEVVSCRVCEGCVVDIAILEIPHLGLSRPKISSNVDKLKYRYPLIISHPAIQWVDPNKQRAAQADANSGKIPTAANGSNPREASLRSTHGDLIMPEFPNERVGGDYGMVVGNLNITADLGWRSTDASPPETGRDGNREVCVSVAPSDPFTRAEFKQDAESLKKPKTSSLDMKSLMGSLPCVDTSEVTLGRPYILPITPRVTGPPEMQMQPLANPKLIAQSRAAVPTVTPFGGSRPPGFTGLPPAGAKSVAGLSQFEVSVLQGGAARPAHVRSNSEGSADYGEVLATSSVPATSQRLGGSKTAPNLEVLDRATASGSHTPSSGYITPRSGMATPIHLAAKGVAHQGHHGGSTSPTKGNLMGGSPPFPGTPSGGSPSYQAGAYPQGGSPQGGSPSGTLIRRKGSSGSSGIGIC